VDVSEVILDEEAPTGLYFKEMKTAANIQVYYYRKGSAASRMSASDLNEAYIAQAKYLFLSGISPALSDSCYEMVLKAIALAKKNNVQVVFDPNLRKKLWSEEKARKVLLEIAAMSDIILPGVAEGEFLFGESDPEKLGALFLANGASLVVIKLGEKGAHYFNQQESRPVPGFKVERVIDPIGAGDGFAAGFLSGLLDGLVLENAVKRGNAIGAIVTQVSGDVEGLPERKDLFRFMAAPIEDVNR
jgi:2-dehydro-3-deoxygluconokinase